jgi:hypothetical protein
MPTPSISQNHVNTDETVHAMCIEEESFFKACTMVLHTTVLKVRWCLRIDHGINDGGK